MKIIFCDVDGVLNAFATYTTPHLPLHEFNPTLMQKCGIELEIHEKQVRLLNELIQKSGASIVLSTSWRKGDDIWWSTLVATLEKAGILPVIIDKTPDLRLNRGDEVQAWLDQHPEVESFVILDDIDEFYNLKENYVATDHTIGLTKENIELAISILERK